MPKFLEKKLMATYGPNSAVPYKVMNAMGVMKGNRETPKGKAMERKHADDSKGRHPHRNLGRYLHPKKSR